MTLKHAVAFAAALATLALTPVAAAHAGPMSRAHTASAARYRLVGFTGSGRLVFNDISHDRIYAVNTDGSGLRLLHRHAKATHVVGQLVVFRSEVHAIYRRHYLDARTGAAHVLPRNWTWLAEGGGLRLARESDGWHLRYLPIDGKPRDWGALTSLPRKAADIRVTASADGLLVAATPSYDAPHGTVAAEFFPHPNRPGHAPLDLHGRSFRNGLDCRALTATISCTDIIGYPHRELIGIDPTGRSAPTVHKVSRRLGDVTFKSGSPDTYAYTTFSRYTDLGQSCPCTLRFSNGVAIRHLDSASIISDSSARRYVYLVRRTADSGTAIYRARFGSSELTAIRR